MNFQTLHQALEQYEKNKGVWARLFDDPPIIGVLRANMAQEVAALENIENSKEKFGVTGFESEHYSDYYNEYHKVKNSQRDLLFNTYESFLQHGDLLNPAVFSAFELLYLSLFSELTIEGLESCLLTKQGLQTVLIKYESEKGFFQRLITALFGDPIAEKIKRICLSLPKLEANDMEYSNHDYVANNPAKSMVKQKMKEIQDPNFSFESASKLVTQENRNFTMRGMIPLLAEQIKGFSKSSKDITSNERDTQKVEANEISEELPQYISIRENLVAFSTGLKDLPASLKGIARDAQRAEAELKLPKVVSDEVKQYLFDFNLQNFTESPVEFTFLIKGLNAKGVEFIWPKIKDAITKRMFYEFGAGYGDDLNNRDFIALIESGKCVGITDLVKSFQGKISPADGRYCRQKRNETYFFSAVNSLVPIEPNPSIGYMTPPSC